MRLGDKKTNHTARAPQSRTSPYTAPASVAPGGTDGRIRPEVADRPSGAAERDRADLCLPCVRGGIAVLRPDHASVSYGVSTLSRSLVSFTTPFQGFRN